MSQLMLVNPKRKKRRKMTAKQAKYFGGGRRRRRASTAVSAARNPKRRTRRRSRVTVRARRNPVAGVVRRMRRSGRARGAKLLGINPGSLIKGTIIPAGIGGAGALLVDVAWGFAPLPASIKTGPLAPVAKIAGAIVVGMLAGKVAGKAMGDKVTSGYLTVMAYNLLKGAVAKAMPSLPLGEYGNQFGYVNAAGFMPDNSISAYISADGYGAPTDGGNTVGAYLNEYDNSFNQ